MSCPRAVQVELVSVAAIVEQGFDAGLRFGQQFQQDMIAVPLGRPLRYAIMASPDYLTKRGRPNVPPNLIGNDCIRSRYPGGTLASWFLYYPSKRHSSAAMRAFIDFVRQRSQ